MQLHVLILIALAGVIYLSCDLFVNAVEWVGRRLNLGASMIGAVLAAFGTALPESAVTFVATVFGRTEASRDIGVGAALGGPLVLATISYAVVGVGILLRIRQGRPVGQTVNARALSNDQAWFLGIFAAKVFLGFVTFLWKPWLAIAFVCAYGLYVWHEVRTDTGSTHEDLEPLKFRPHDTSPNLSWSAGQLVASLVVIGVASHYFVGQLEVLGQAWNIAPHMVALLLSPIATELPETMNAIIWIRQGKTPLALANISGAMMIQATIPSALGIAFTPWRFDAPLAISGFVTMLAIVWLWWMFRRGTLRPWRLAAVSLGYVVFAVAMSMI